MQTAPPAITVRAIRTPRAAAVAGIVFSLLFATSVVLTKWAIPPGSENAGTWVRDDTKRNAVSLGLNLLPFAGIAFLWFIGVLRDRIGQGEDRFFATVFLGSGLLFVAMFFVSGAIAGALVNTAAESGSAGRVGSVWPFGRRGAASLATVYGMRMAAVFTISTSTIASRLHLVPRWLAVLGYATAVVLLAGSGVIPWLELLFPGWVFVLSVHILVAAFARSQRRDENT
jgi:predicted membrane channel-forming protein YqfA (hemolysin III family)